MVKRELEKEAVEGIRGHIGLNSKFGIRNSKQIPNSEIQTRYKEGRKGH